MVKVEFQKQHSGSTITCIPIYDDFLYDDDFLERIIIAEKNRELVEIVEGCLREREYEIIIKRYGLDDGTMKTLEEVEDSPGVTLPAGVQFYGVAHKPLINIDCTDRPNDSYIVIGALCTGDPVLLRKDSEQISIYNQEAGRIEDDEIYDDFFAFLSDLHDLPGVEG